MQITNICEGHISRQPLAATFGLMMIAALTFSMFPPVKIQILFFAISACQYAHHTILAQEIFRVMENKEQATQINKLHSASFSCLLFVCILLYVQKIIEANIWRMAESSYERSEALTKEVIESSEAKDIFVSSLSHEIRNPLNALNGSIDYLIEAVKDADQLDILKNAQLSAQILLNLANNVLDAAKLRSDKIEIMQTEANFVEVITKTFSINAEALKKQEIKLDTYFRSAIPKILWTDPSRLLQVMMNLMSNALKFTPRGGKIQVQASWWPLETSKEKLLEREDWLFPDALDRSEDDRASPNK